VEIFAETETPNPIEPFDTKEAAADALRRSQSKKSVTPKRIPRGGAE
jgi:hypothetical protein